MEAKHTPGTWELVIARTMVHLHGAAGYFGISLPWKTEQDKANARLIAAAPELLEALETLLQDARPVSWEDNDDPEQVEAWKKAQAAISKARGQQ